MDVVELKSVASEMMSAMIAFGIKTKTRAELRSVVVERIKKLSELGDRERRFVGDHVMALYGYGGGLY